MLSGNLLCILLLLPIVAYGETDLENKAKLKAIKMPPCEACRVFVTAFKKRVEETARGKFEGGDVAWEESHQLDYQRSELRLIEIQEKLCQGIGRGEDQCITNAEEYEPLLEEWWFHSQDNEPDVHQWLCIQQLKLCCPPGTYGPDCKECPGSPNNVCNNNGRCKGSGTRSGNGECACDKGYLGSNCDECASGYYESYRDEDKMMCSPCYVACDKACTGPGTKGCTQCKSGWVLKPDDGCYDINECLEYTGTCQTNQFCVNNEGSYSCLECDRACKGCSGDGPDMCQSCAEGYQMQDGMCVESLKFHSSQQAAMTRYLTYLGLCVATFIIFNRNIGIAMAIGAMVSVYITISEYMYGTEMPFDLSYLPKMFQPFGNSED